MGDLLKTLLSKYVAPLKIWIYIGLALAAVTYWEVHNYHERKIGAAALAAKVNELGEARQHYINDLDTEANTKAAQLETAYEKARATPSTNHRSARLCLESHASSNVVPSPVEGTSGDHGPTDSGEGNNLTAGPDIGDNLINIGKRADDQVKALQQRVRDLEQEMRDANTQKR